MPITRKGNLQSVLPAYVAKALPKTIPNKDAIEKNEKPLERSSLETISPINEKMLGINAPYPIPVKIVKKKKTE